MALQFTKVLVFFERKVMILFDFKLLKVNMHDKLSRVKAKRSIENMNPKVVRKNEMKKINFTKGKKHR